MEKEILKDQWSIITKFLPDNWEEKAFEMGAIVRRKKITSPQDLLRVLFIHLAAGKSLRSTTAYAKEAEVCDINDVALLHRLRVSSEWLRWMALELLKKIRFKSLPDQFYRKFRIMLVDGTVVNEPGSTGSDWRIHYSVVLRILKCDSFSITSTKEGESFQRYPVVPDDLLVADRNYCKRKDIMYVLNKKAHVLVRFHSTNLPLCNRKGKPLNILSYLRTLKEGDIGDWDVWFHAPGDRDGDKDNNRHRLIKGRICSIKKSPQAIELDIKNILKSCRKKGHKCRPETLEYAKYFILFTTVNRHQFKAKDILTLYRGRWQIELVFKRLKSIVKIGHLPKKEEESCIAWLHGKILLAILTERIYQEAEFFSPWGYPL